MFTLQKPLRLVVDIENADLKIRLPQLETGNSHVSAIRSGRPNNKVLRFVFELKKPLRSNSFLLSPNELYGHRLVVDLDDESTTLSTLVKGGGEHADTEIRVATNGQNGQPPQTKAEYEPVFMPAADKKLIIAIDAGHGGEDPGAIGYRGNREKTLTLAVAQKLQKKIDQDPRMKAVMIRKGDYYIKLHKRRLLARELNADIFVSIHADAFRKKSARGFSVFALSQRGATSAMARALAEKENASDLIGGVSLANKDDMLAQVLVDLSMTNTISESVNLGGRVLKELSKLGKLHSQRVEQAGFAVLKSPDIPSILIETGFITNPQEEKNLRSPAYQMKVANAIYTAMDQYYKQTPHYANASYAVPNHSSARQSGQVTNSPGPQYHTVKRGDSLSKISVKYNVTIGALKSVNKLKKNTVYTGQKIKLPANVKISRNKPNLYKAKLHKVKLHKVKRGDTLSEIAEQYGSSIKKIMSFNKMRNRTVMLGQTLKIPY